MSRAVMALWRHLERVGAVTLAEGMLTQYGRVDAEGYCGLRHVEECPGIEPNLNEPGTIGVLTELARVAWDDPGLHVVGSYVAADNSCIWTVRGGKHHGAGFRRMPGSHPSEAHALLVAIEHAPGTRR